ncbi:TIGR01777 family oxidoreductase [Listeria goaensis]|uniref:TIGR01777 family oxidoreductase n=1 Tax=Listeria goaensis TaxID=1649188 RepID=UPI000B58BD89|nr:TIGR01777 family oxidoreductase [Listeria goaensis]
MKILIAGGTGFVGRHLTHDFEKTMDDIYILTRGNQADYANVHFINWLTDETPLPDLKEHVFDAVINLAGVNLADGRYTEERKRAIVSSRVEATAALLAIVRKMNVRPKVWINASAIGVYPSSKTAIYSDSEETPMSRTFLARTVHEWEETAIKAEQYGIRVAFARFGLILGTDGGAFPIFEKAFRNFFGGRFGSGKQWYSWIHIDDVISAIRFIIQKEELDGAINLVAPHPVQEKKFAELLGKKLHRPYKTPVPKRAIRLALADKAAMILDSQRVYPDKLLAHHFEFTFNTLEEALDDLINEEA